MIMFRPLTLLITICLTLGSIRAQTTADFESFGLGIDSFANDARPADAWADGNVRLPNAFDTTFNSYSGWAISSMADTTTAGFTNQYSSIAGGGADGSATFGVQFGQTGRLILDGAAAGGVVEGMYVTNSTYAALSMRDGDAFAKRFGGATGDDPDYFALTVKAWHDGVLGSDSVEVFLADYRFADNAQDFILRDWQWVDLASLGNADSLWFGLRSTDNGMFGMNTPAYFLADGIRTADSPVGLDRLVSFDASLLPNPSSDGHLSLVRSSIDEVLTVRVIDATGRVLESRRWTTDRLDLALDVAPGVYHVVLSDGRRTDVRAWMVR